MKITNITEHDICLIDGSIIKPYNCEKIDSSNKKLIEQVKSLERNKLIVIA